MRGISAGKSRSGASLSRSERRPGCDSEDRYLAQRSPPWVEPGTGAVEDRTPGARGRQQRGGHADPTSPRTASQAPSGAVCRPRHRPPVGEPQHRHGDGDQPDLVPQVDRQRDAVEPPRRCGPWRAPAEPRQHQHGDAGLRHRERHAASDGGLRLERLSPGTPTACIRVAGEHDQRDHRQHTAASSAAPAAGERRRPRARATPSAYGTSQAAQQRQRDEPWPRSAGGDHGDAADDEAAPGRGGRSAGWRRDSTRYGSRNHSGLTTSVATVFRVGAGHAGEHRDGQRDRQRAEERDQRGGERTEPGHDPAAARR